MVHAVLGKLKLSLEEGSGTVATLLEAEKLSSNASGNPFWLLVLLVAAG